MIYTLIKAFFKMFTLIFFRKFWVTGYDKIPVDKGLLIVGNHPSAFLDALMVLFWSERQVYFLARGDVFANPKIGKFLNRLNILPIYRRSEGVENMPKNESTFATCIDFFRKKRAVIIFAEGLCIQEKRLRKLKKGTARLALESECDNNVPVAVVPVGVNYVHFDSYREEAMIHVGDELDLSEHKEIYKEYPSKAVLNLTKDLELKLSELVLQILPRENDALAEKILPIYRDYFPGNVGPSIIKSDDRFLKEKKILTHLQSISEDTDLLKELNGLTDKYEESKKKHEIKEYAFYHEKKFSTIKQLVYFIFSALLAPITLINALPIQIGRSFGPKLVRGEEFGPSLVIVLSFFIYWVLLTITVLIISLKFGLLVGIGCFIIIPLLGYFGLRSWEGYKIQTDLKRFIRFKNSSADYDPLYELRLEIVNRFGLSIPNV